MESPKEYFCYNKTCPVHFTTDNLDFAIFPIKDDQDNNKFIWEERTRHKFHTGHSIIYFCNVCAEKRLYSKGHTK